ncbi:ileal sodium/bile acid cotransporter-like isoform X1 [Syngnathus scovelli]|uniref:ileal sodium/bile acid cotransporter-like isoform X1 n=1 Tax=Syngnathus scovelli TaxID=161590 RepID=UPI0035CB670C
MSIFTDTTAELAACLSEATICSGDNCLVPPNNFNSILSLALSTVATALLAIIMFSMGCAVEVSKFWGHLRRPWCIVIGFLFQFGIMPFTAFALSIAFNVQPAEAIVIIILGCCPGGSSSNVTCLFLDGDMDLSISMTACSTVLSLGMMPLCLLVYTSTWTTSSNIQIPYDSIGITVAAILVPITGGIYIKHKWPHIAQMILKVGTVTGFSFLVIVSVLGAVVYEYSWNLNPSLWIIGTIFPFIGFGMGFILARFVGQPWYRCRTIAVETGFQNSQLCNTIIQLSFSPAELEIMFAFPILYSIFQLVWSSLIVTGYQAYKKSRGLGTIQTNSEFPSLEDGSVKEAKKTHYDVDNSAFELNKDETAL